MTNTNAALRKHLSNIIYIDNGFSLELFKPTPVIPEQLDTDSEEEIVMRNSPAMLVETVSKSNTTDIEKNMTVETFFEATQDYAPDLNILPYHYDPVKFWSNIEPIKQKLSHFPLIIIDWSLEGEGGKKTGIDVFDEIVKSSEILHYYVIYSNEVSGAIEAFKSKYSDVQFGSISENNVAMVKDVIIMFANKQNCNANHIIDKLASFTVENYGYLPQLFLSAKQQIENRTAVLYNDFMGLDSMMLPQLVIDEAYNYEGMQEEIVLSLIVNKLREEIVIEKQDDSYGKLALNKLLASEFSEEAFERAKKDVQSFPNISFDKFKERVKKIADPEFKKDFDVDSLKNIAQVLREGKIEDKKSSVGIKEINNSILFLSICGDKNYYEKYVKLLSIIKFTEYKPDLCWFMEDCKDEIKTKSLCQGDIFIDEKNESFLLCITPSCQLIRPEKIENTYTFLKGSFAKNELQKNQKQSYSMHLINKEKNKVLLVNWDFFSPLVIDFKKEESLSDFKSYKRYYRLNIEYIHQIVELYSEYIKQIGVEEVFGKRIKEKGLFLETRRDDNDSN